MRAIARLVALCACMLCECASAQWPAKPIRFIVASSAGSGLTLVARIYAPALQQALGQPVVLENHPSAGGVVGMELATRSAPDGYTFLAANGTTVFIGPTLYKKVAELVRQLVPVSPVARTSIYLVARSGLPAHSVAELVQHAKANPGKLTYGSTGNGTLFHIEAAMFARAAGFQAVHVPYTESGRLLTDISGGRIDFMFDPGSSIPFIKSGKLQLLAVVGSGRSRMFPDVPTLEESGIANMEVPNWIGLVVPSGTPRDIVARVNREVAASFSSPEAVKAYEAWSMIKPGTSSEEFAAKIDREIAVWGPIIKKLNISLD